MSKKWVNLRTETYFRCCVNSWDGRCYRNIMKQHFFQLVVLKRLAQGWSDDTKSGQKNNVSVPSSDIVNDTNVVLMTSFCFLPAWKSAYWIDLDTIHDRQRYVLRITRSQLVLPSPDVLQSSRFAIVQGSVLDAHLKVISKSGRFMMVVDSHWESGSIMKELPAFSKYTTHDLMKLTLTRCTVT